MKKLLILTSLLLSLTTQAQTIYTDANGMGRCANIIPIPVSEDSPLHYITRLYVEALQHGDMITLNYYLQANVIKDSSTNYWVNKAEGTATLPYDRTITGNDLEHRAFGWIQQNFYRKDYNFIRVKFQYQQ